MTLEPHDMDKMVQEALQRAKVNGYDMSHHAPSDVAQDLIMYDADFIGFALDDVTRSVQRLRKTGN